MPNSKRRRSTWSRLLQFFLWTILLLAVVVAARVLYAFRDRNPGYAVNINIEGKEAKTTPRPLRIGFGRVKINPDISNPNRPVWVAGFSQNRPATGIHDDLWAVASVIDDGYTRVAVVVLDAIGFFHDDVISVRKRLEESWKLDYAIVCSTHNHSTPDLMGLWGPNYFRSGVDQDYRRQVIQSAAKAVGGAIAALQPARVAVHEIPMPTDGVVADTRKPIVFDPDIRVMHFRSPTNGVTIGSIVGWANHPETPWSKNQEITADFPGVIRDVLEKGVQVDGQTVEAGLGGIHLFVNGAVGGLMSTTPSVTVHDPYFKKDFKEPTHEKSRAVGHQIVSRILPKLRSDQGITLEHLPISIRAKTIELPLGNDGFLLAPVIGLMDRGHVRWKILRTEVAVLTFGEVSVACIPGEIYPEIVNGGIEKAPGADFGIEPLEIPALRDLMPGKIKFIFGLANDEIGYIIPKSEWDTEPPYLYDSQKGVYGEVNSVGPETAVLIHQAIRDLCRPPGS